MENNLFQLRNLPIRRKFTLIILLTSAAAMLLVNSVIVVYETMQIRRSLVRELSTEAEIIAANSAAALAFSNAPAAEEVLKALAVQPEILHACLFDLEGKPFAEFKTRIKNLPILARRASGYLFEKDYLLVFRDVKYEGKVVGSLGLRSDLREPNARLHNNARLAVFTILAALLVSFVISLKLQSAISKPILELADLANRVTTCKDYSLRANKRSSDEIGVLTGEFNQMLAQIEKSDSDLRNSEERFRQLAHSLQAAETKYRDIFENAIEGAFQTTPDGRFITANLALARMLGYTSPEELMTSVTNLGEQLCVDPESRASLGRQLEKQDEVWEFENQLRRKDGKRIWISTNVRSQRDNNGNLLYYAGTSYDITERKRIEETLRRTEQVYRKAISGAGAVPYARDYKTKSYLFIGEGIEKLIGYSPQEMESDIWQRIKQESVMLGEAAGLTLEEAIKKVGSGEIKNWRCDIRVLTRDGQSRWISDVSVQNLNESGELIGSMGILQDITDRKQAEKKSAAFAALAFQLSAATTSEEAAGQILKTAAELIGWDCGFVHLYDRERDQIVPILTVDLVDGKQTIVPPPNLYKASPMTRLIVEKGALLIDEQNRSSVPVKFVPFGNKNLISASMMYVPIRQGANVIGVLSIQRYTANVYHKEDLSLLQALADHCSGALQRIKVTKELLEAEAKYRAIVEGATEGIFQSTPSGKYLHGNHALARMFGYENYAEMCASVTDIERQTYVLPERRQELKRLLEFVGEIRGFEAERYRKDGSKFWMSTNARMVRDANGEILYYEGTARDVTARRHLEKQIIEISDREQSRMGQDLHDGLCQHLVLTAFAANLLQKDLTAQPDASFEQANKVSYLVNEAITQARNLARGLYPVKLESEGFHSAIQELADNIRSTYQVDCDFELADSVSIPGHAEATHLYRIAQEAAINAVKHAKAKCIQIGLHKVSDKIHLTVADDGTGISAPFANSNGMGLHIMNYRAGMIGADLKIEPRPSGGTLVSCIFKQKSRSD